MKQQMPSLTFSIGTILAVTVVVSVLTAITVKYPGIGIFTLILAAPAAARTIMINLARRRRGESLSALAKCAYFASSLLITLLVSGSAIFLFVTICTPISIFIVSSRNEDDYQYRMVLLVAVWGMAAATGLSVATLIARLLWWRKEFITSPDETPSTSAPIFSEEPTGEDQPG